MNISLPEPNMAAAAQSAPDQIIRYDSGSDAEKTALKDVIPSSKPKIDIAPDQLRDMLLDSLGEALKEYNKYHDLKAFLRHTKKLSLENVVNLVYFMTGDSRFFGNPKTDPFTASSNLIRLLS